MIDMQALIDGKSAQWQKERAETQITLGKLINKLESMSPDTVIHGLGELDSYRGYYCDLAFDPDCEKISAGDLLKQCRGAMGEIFEGYKGGEYAMHANTPLWVAEYGECGKKLVDVLDSGEVITAEDND